MSEGAGHPIDTTTPFLGVSPAQNPSDAAHQVRVPDLDCRLRVGEQTLDCRSCRVSQTTNSDEDRTSPVREPRAHVRRRAFRLPHLGWSRFLISSLSSASVLSNAASRATSEYSFAVGGSSRRKTMSAARHRQPEPPISRPLVVAPHLVQVLPLDACVVGPEIMQPSVDLRRLQGTVGAKVKRLQRRRVRGVQDQISGRVIDYQLSARKLRIRVDIQGLLVSFPSHPVGKNMGADDVAVCHPVGHRRPPVIEFRSLLENSNEVAENLRVGQNHVRVEFEKEPEVLAFHHDRLVQPRVRLGVREVFEDPLFPRRVFLLFEGRPAAIELTFPRKQCQHQNSRCATPHRPLTPNVACNRITTILDTAGGPVQPENRLRLFCGRFASAKVSVNQLTNPSNAT